jgi:hypothetical protein
MPAPQENCWEHPNFAKIKFVVGASCSLMSRKRARSPHYKKNKFTHLGCSQIVCNILVVSVHYVSVQKSNMSPIAEKSVENCVLSPLLVKQGSSAPLKLK